MVVWKKAQHQRIACCFSASCTTSHNCDSCVVGNVFLDFVDWQLKCGLVFPENIDSVFQHSFVVCWIDTRFLVLALSWETFYGSFPHNIFRVIFNDFPNKLIDFFHSMLGQLDKESSSTKREWSVIKKIIDIGKLGLRKNSFAKGFTNRIQCRFLRFLFWQAVFLVHCTSHTFDFPTGLNIRPVLQSCFISMIGMVHDTG